MDNSQNIYSLSLMCLSVDPSAKVEVTRETEVERSVKIFTLNSYEWNNEVVEKLRFIKEIEIHLRGWVYRGKVSYISRDFENTSIRICFNSAVRNERFSLVYLQDIPEFSLEECRKPTYLCEENGCGVSYFGFKNGHVVLSTFNFL